MKKSDLFQLTASFFLLKRSGNEGDVEMLTVQEIAALEHNIDNVWSLSDYLTHLNTNARAQMAATPGLWVSEFTEDLSHWAEIEVTTARNLANYLDACFQREVEKSRYDMIDEDYHQSKEDQRRKNREEQARLKAQYVNVQPEPSNVLLDAFLNAKLA